MALKERFSTDEWEMLCSVPVQVYSQVILADKKVEEPETKAIGDALAAAAQSTLMREVADDILSTGLPPLDEASLRAAADAADTTSERARQLLREKLTADEYPSFGAGIHTGATIVGCAGSRGIKRHESKVLQGIASDWDVPEPMGGWADHFRKCNEWLR